MATAVIALGSNIGDRCEHLSDAKSFLTELSTDALTASSIYITEPIGPASRDFYNAIVVCNIAEEPSLLIKKCKQFEADHGRSAQHQRWSARTIDLDIICYDDLVIHTDNLIIPHPEYHNRLFVLEPLLEIVPDWVDPKSGATVDELITQAPDMRIRKTDLHW